MRGNVELIAGVSQLAPLLGLRGKGAQHKAERRDGTGDSNGELGKMDISVQSIVITPPNFNVSSAYKLETKPCLNKSCRVMDVNLDIDI